MTCTDCSGTYQTERRVIHQILFIASYFPAFFIRMKRERIGHVCQENDIDGTPTHRQNDYQFSKLQMQTNTNRYDRFAVIVSCIVCGRLENRFIVMSHVH